MYRVVHLFSDLQDNGRIYQAGDVFPRPDFSVSDARLSQLASSNNRLGTPLIVKVAETPKFDEIHSEEGPTKEEEISLAESEQALKAQKTQNKRGRKKKDDVNA